MRRPNQPRARRRAGLTLVELVVAAGLATLLFVALFSVLEDFLSLWDRSEERRALAEETSGVLELLAEDLAVLEAGRRGDFVGEWVLFDTDGDGLTETKWPRLRMVRNASPAELQRLQGPPDPDAIRDPADEVRPEGLIEVIWAVLPTGGALANVGSTEREFSAEGYLWRGERIYGPDRGADVSFFADGFIGSTGLPRAGTLNEVTGSVLWLGVRYATQTSLIRPEDGGWRLDGGLAGVTAAWDAWGRGRPDAERHYWNECDLGAPSPGRARLPRRVRLELELEHAADLKRRTRLAEALDSKSSGVSLVDGERLPDPGGFVLIGGEWMELVSVSGELATVRRGARGTAPAQHEAGALVHYGRTSVREVPVGTFREDWDL